MRVAFSSYRANTEVPVANIGRLSWRKTKKSVAIDCEAIDEDLRIVGSGAEGC